MRDGELGDRDDLGSLGDLGDLGDLAEVGEEGLSAPKTSETIFFIANSFAPSSGPHLAGEYFPFCWVNFKSRMTNAEPVLLELESSKPFAVNTVMKSYSRTEHVCLCTYLHCSKFDR